MKDLMLNVIDPAADGVWEAVGTVSTIEGVFEKFPATDDEWAGVRSYAIQLAESGNLLMLPARSNGSPEDPARPGASPEPPASTGGRPRRSSSRSRSPRGSWRSRRFAR